MSGSSYERTGGYASPAEPVRELPVVPHLWLTDDDGVRYHATECWCWSSGMYERTAANAKSD
jgi:hypothetical protein